MASQTAPVFGRSLKELFAGGQLPAVFWHTLKFLSQRALTVEGLFRAKGDGRKVTLMKRLYDSGKDPLKVIGVDDPHAVAGVLKLWLSLLPEPVIPAGMYAAVLRTQRHDNYEHRLTSLQIVLRQMEHHVLQVLFPLMEFLHHYGINQRHGRAPPPDLARVFGPLLMRPDGRSIMIACPQEQSTVHAVVSMLIQDYRTLFSQKKAAQRALPAAAAAAAEEKAAPASPPTSPPSSPKWASSLKALKVFCPPPVPDAALQPASPTRQDNRAPASPNGNTFESIMADQQAASAAQGAATASSAGAAAEPWFDELISDLLFDSTTALFAGDPATADLTAVFYSTSPCSTPDAPHSPPALVELDTDNDTAMSDGMGEEEEVAAVGDLVMVPDEEEEAALWGSADLGHIPAAAGKPPTATQHILATGSWVRSRSDDGLVPVWGGAGQSCCGGRRALSELSLDELCKEKSALKAELRRIDSSFEAAQGRTLSKVEKEHLRPLYVRYWKIKRAIRCATLA